MTATKSLLIVLLVAGLAVGTPGFGQIADALPQYLQQLKDAKPEERAPIIAKVAEFDDPRAVEALVGLLGEKNVSANEASNALGHMGTLAVGPLLAKVRDPDPQVREQAIILLNMIFTAKYQNEDEHAQRDTGYIDAVLTGTTDTDLMVVDYAIRGLGIIGPEPSGRIENAFLEALLHHAAFAVNTVYQHHHPGIRAVLLTLLHHEDPKVREMAVGWLSYYYKDSEALGAVIKSLSELLHTTAGRNQTTFEELGAIEDPRAVEVLIPLVRDNDLETQSFACEALVNTHQAGVSDILFRVAMDTSLPPHTRYVAASSFTWNPEQLLTAWTQADEAGRTGLIGACFHLDDPRVTDIVLRRYSSFDDEKRTDAWYAIANRHDLEALRILGAIARGRDRSQAFDAIERIGYDSNTDKALPMLVQLLKLPDWTLKTIPQFYLLNDDVDHHMHALVVRAMRNLCTQAAADCLLTYLHSRDASIRSAAAQSLENYLPDPRVLPALITALRDKAAQLNAAIALANIGDPRGSEILLTALKNPKERDKAAKAIHQILHLRRGMPMLLIFWNGVSNQNDILRALINQQDAQVIPVLITLLQDKQYGKWALSVLTAIGDQHAVPPLIAIASGADKGKVSGAVKSLGLLKDPRAIPAIVQSMDTPATCRKYAAPALAAMGEAAYQPALTLLTDPRPWVREAGATVLGQLGNTHAEDALLAAVNDPDPDTRASVITASAQLHLLRAVPLLRPLLQDANPLLRKGAASALGDLGDNISIPQLRALLADVNLPVRYAAATALAQLGDEQGLTFLRKGLTYTGRDNVADIQFYNLALNGLVQANPADLTDILLAALDSGKAGYVIAELGHRKDTRAIPSLMKLLTNDTGIDAVCAALREITGQPWQTAAQWRYWWSLQQQQ